MAVAPTISGDAAAGKVGTAYDFTYTVTGEPAPSVTLLSGSLPPGLSLGSNGQLVGTPTEAGTFTFTTRAENFAGTAQVSSTVTVSPKSVTATADLRVDVAAPTSAVKGKTYTCTVKTTNAGSAISKSVYTKVVLPSGVTFVSASGDYRKIANVIVFRRTALTAGQTVMERITVKGTKKEKEIALAATFSVKTPDPVVRNNVDTVATVFR